MQKKYNTYKSIWYEDEDGNYVREQKQRYVMEKLTTQSLRFIPKVRGLMSLLGRSPQGVDYYKPYLKDIQKFLSGDRQKWVNELSKIEKELEGIVVLKDKKILDISGEPGFFATDLVKQGNEVLVTAVTKDVADMMADKLLLNTRAYDFNQESLHALIQDQYDLVFIRYSIGFCEELQPFIESLKKTVVPGGLVYVSFSPASRAFMARWMFEYTCLRQYTKSTMIRSFSNLGFSLLKEINQGSYFWDEGLPFIQKLCSKPYLKEIFHNANQEEYYQHNLALVFSLPQ